MKKTISLITLLFVVALFLFTGFCQAVSLDTIDVQTDKTTVRPGENVKVTIEFGTALGAYTFDVSYDKNIFDYVSAEGGTPNNTGDKVKVVYHDPTGGTNPRTNMSVIFKAKADITTSNPTEFTVTGEGLSNADASVTYDDITSPIIKNVTVEPAYVDYTLTLEHSGNLIKGEEKEMKLSYSSPMGRYYEHARLVAEVTTPSGATVNLKGTDSANVEHDIIQSGWGDAQGYKIGGKDVSQILNLKATFSDAGDYTITLKLIDRDNSDQDIAKQTFNFTVLAENPPAEQPITPEITNPTEESTEKPKEEIQAQQTPTKLPKTGVNNYVPIVIILIGLITLYAYNNKKTK